MNKQTTQSGLLSFWVLLIGLAIIVLGISFAHAAAPEGRSLAIDRNGTDFNLRWTGITNAIYEPQVSTNLVQGNWDFLSTVIGTGGQIVYPVSSSNLPSAFFRVLFPQPVVTAGEPARYAHGTGGSYLYITGQYFYSGDQVRVGGILANNAVLVSPSLLRVELPPGLPPGRHDVEILSNSIGAVLATLHEAVTVVDPLADPDLLLYGPPEEPPGSPQASRPLVMTYLKKKINKWNSYFAPPPEDEPDNPSSQGGRDFFTLKPHRSPNPSAMDLDVVEGKKGLNAVNVKLARLLGVSNIGSSGQDGVSNIGSSGQDGVNIGSSGQDGVNIGSSGQDGVNCFSGDVQQQVVDLAIEGRGLDFVWARTYHSRIGRTGSSTNGWTFSYDLHLQPLGGDILIHNGTGRADRYMLQTNGVYTCPEFFCEGRLNTGVFRLTFADTGYWEFKPLGTAPDAGKIDRIVDRNGNTISMNYDTNGRLATIVDTLGRACTVSYDTAGRLVSVTDSFGRTMRYEYDVHGDLVACISPAVTDTPTGNDFPNGKTNRYTYTSSTVEAESHLLTSCVDALGQTTAQFGYDLSSTSSSYLRCTSFRRGDHPPTMLTYQPQTPTTNNHFATLRCIVNDPEGNVNVILYDCRNRGIEKEQIKRRAEPGTSVADISTLPYDKLRQEDPDSTVTRWSWNNDSLCTSERAPGGQEVRCTYQCDLVPTTPARKRADCRVVREIASSPVDLDGDGVADTSERVWRYEFDPRFGSSAASSKYFIHAIHAGRLGIGVTAVGATFTPPPLAGKIVPTVLNHAVNTKGTGCQSGKAIKDFQDGEVCDDGNTTSGDGFVTSVTDPRGNVTQSDYDAQGNRKEIRKPIRVNLKTSFVHDAYGQLVAITNAPDANGRSRVDTFAWSQGQVTTCVVDAAPDGLALTTSYEYDTRGNLTRYVDPRGNDWLLSCNSLNQCVRIRPPVCISTRSNTDFFFDANDNLVRCDTEVRDETDALIGVKTDRATYDTLRRLTEVALAVDATNALTNRFEYDGNDQCTRVLGGDAVSGADPYHTVSFVYDTCGLLYRSVAATGSVLQCTTQYDYDVNGLVTRVSEGLEETPSITTLAYDGFAGFGSFPAGIQSKKLESINKGGSNFAQTQAMKGQKAKAWMVNNFTPLGVTKKMMGAPKIGEATGRVSQITDPMGNVTTFHHDVNDNLIVARQFGQMMDVPGSDGNIRLAESRYEYDGLDRCVVQRDLHFALAAPQSPVGDGECTTAFAYAPNGACTGITNDLGQVTTVAYDKADRVYAISIPAGKTLLACLRDAAGNVTSVTQTDTAALGGPPQAFTRTYVYDSRSRCVSTTDGVGKTNSCAYDSLSRVVRSTDAAGTPTFHHYDLFGHRTATVGDLDGDGLEDFARDITQQASWSPSNGRLLSTTDSHGNTTSYAYDSRGRCTAVSHADGTHEQLIWSLRSNLSQMTDANGCVISYTYNLNDCLGKADIAFGLPDATTTFEAFRYDGCGRLTGHTNDTCGGNSAYDSLGNCVSESLNGLATTSTYDALGNRLSLAYPGGRLLAYAYAASGCCTNIAESGASLARFAYDGVDRLARVTYGNGLHSTFEYDGLDGVPNAPGDHGFGQVSHVVHASTNGSLASEVKFSWNLKENKGARIMPPTGTSGSTNVLTLEYDRADRLIHSIVTGGTTAPRDTTYGLDRMGNRTNVIGGTWPGVYELDPAAPPADFQVNQYTATPSDSRSYDDNGNLASRNSFADGALTVYAYDYADRLVAVQAVVDGGTGLPSTNLVASYTYDALGRRVTKTLYSGGLPPSIRHYCYDGSCVIEERENNAVVQSYVHATGLADKVTENDQVLQMRVGTQDYFVLADDQGNTLALVDASGMPVEFYFYDDYGAVTFLTSDGTPTTATSSPLGNPYCWGGLRLDAETGLHNNDGGNYFEPQAGRATRGKIRIVRDSGNGFASNADSSASVAAKHYITIPHDRRVPGGSNGNNPWSGGTPLGMKTGTVKFFNDAKGFGRQTVTPTVQEPVAGKPRAFFNLKPR